MSDKLRVRFGFVTECNHFLDETGNECGKPVEWAGRQVDVRSVFFLCDEHKSAREAGDWEFVQKPITEGINHGFTYSQIR